MIEKSKGFIIRRRIYRDTSLLLKVYTYDFGKLEGIVKGVRKIENFGRYDGFIDLLSNYEIVFYSRKSDLVLFVQFYLLKSYWDILKDYDKFSLTSLGLELLDYITQLYDVNTEIYQLLESFLDNIEECYMAEVILYAFIIKLLRYSGFHPQIDECIKCKKKIFNRSYFSLSEGGLVCLTCGAKRDNLLQISSGAIKSINFLNAKPYSDIKRLRLSSGVRMELDRILDGFISYHISFIPKNSKILKKDMVQL